MRQRCRWPPLTDSQVRECCITPTGAAGYPQGDAAHSYQRLLSVHNVQVSMSRKGDCYDNYDNSVMESCFSMLKSECVADIYSSRVQSRQAIFECVEVWYNRQRRYSALGYESPEASEKRYFESIVVSTNSG